MRGDAVGAGLDRGQRGAHRIGPRSRPCITQGSDVIDIDPEAQRRSFWHGGLAGIQVPDCLILRSGAFAASRRMRGCIVAAWFETAHRTAQALPGERLLTTRTDSLPIDALDACDDGL